MICIDNFWIALKCLFVCMYVAHVDGHVPLSEAKGLRLDVDISTSPNCVRFTEYPWRFT